MSNDAARFEALLKAALEQRALARLLASLDGNDEPTEEQIEQILANIDLGSLGALPSAGETTTAHAESSGALAVANAGTGVAAGLPSIVSRPARTDNPEPSIALPQPAWFARAPWRWCGLIGLLVLGSSAIVGFIVWMQIDKQPEIDKQPLVSSSYSIQDHYFPSGIMGNTKDVESQSRPDNIVWFKYTAAGAGTAEWDQKYLRNGTLNKDRAPFSGVVFQNPANNWGEIEGGRNLRALKPDKVVWEVRRLSSEPFIVEFFTGSDGWVWKENPDGTGQKVKPPFPDSMPRTSLGHEAPELEWKTFEKRLLFDEKHLERVVCAFGWVIIPGQLDGKVREFEVKNIRFERSDR